MRGCRKRALFQAELSSILFLLFLISSGSLSRLAGKEKREQKPLPPPLAIEVIMKGEDFLGASPNSVMWSFDGKRLYFRWKKPGENNPEFYSAEPPDWTPRQTTRDEILSRPPVARSSSSPFSTFGFSLRGVDHSFDKEKKRAVIVENGDIRLLDLTTGKSSLLLSTEANESGARFAHDQKKISFRSGDNLFLLSLEDFSLRQMTSFLPKKSAEENKPDDIDNWYINQQQELFQEFKKKEERRGHREMMSPLQPSPRRQSFFLGENERISALELGADENYALFIISEHSGEGRETIVPQYVTRSGYTETQTSHPKAADALSRAARVGVMSTVTGEVKWFDFGQGERKILPWFLIWSPDGKKSLLLAQSEDRKDRWLFLLDPAGAKASIIESVHDDAWIGPLGLTNIFWWPDSLHVSYISEKDGYAHLYRASTDGQKKEQLTSGKFEVTEAHISQDGKTIYLVTSEEHPGEIHLYTMSAQGGRRTKLTTIAGQNEAFLSPDEKNLAFLFSATNKPPDLYIQPNKPGAAARQLTLSTTEEFRSYSWHEPEIVTIKSRDGVDVCARLYKPKNWRGQGPAVIFIHGAGYLQNAHKGWSTYYREYMFHNFLTEKGYIVLDVDYRGSSGYGRDFRTAIYRHMGGKDLDDIVDAAKYLAAVCQVDPSRIGIYGGSYGGFLTLMAMFKTPEYFRAGAALRPVTDWAHYHPWYTVDILNLPYIDPEAYKQSSPIYFADGLKGALLICHGMVDSNVHFQDTVRLVQRLIELGKENWEVAIYPVEEHSFQNSTSWTDEYKRIFRLFETNLK